MRLQEVLNAISEFAKGIEPLVGLIDLKIRGPLDLSVFPDELKKLDGVEIGAYILHEQGSDRVLYVGQSIQISNRVYAHIGTNYTWAWGGAECSFPNFTLTQSENVPEEIKAICQSGKLNVTAVGVSPVDARKLIESFAVYYSHQKGDKFPLNIDF